ncbi:hypothetical protein EJB05_00365, partial [Eragrostis curvula]
MTPRLPSGELKIENGKDGIVRNIRHHGFCNQKIAGRAIMAHRLHVKAIFAEGNHGTSTPWQMSVLTDSPDNSTRRPLRDITNIVTRGVIPTNATERLPRDVTNLRIAGGKENQPVDRHENTGIKRQKKKGDEMDEPVVVEENYPMILFRDINLDLITSKINFSAKVYFKANVRLHKDGNYIRLILVDEEGTRMEALAFGRTCLGLARTIVEGEPYDFIDVVVGYRYDLNFLNILVIHVRSPHILLHAGEWRPAAQYFNTIVALHVQMNTRRGVLVTTRYSKIIFEPDRPEAEAMRDSRDCRVNVELDKVLPSEVIWSDTSSRKNSEVKRAWPGAISGWVTDREVVPGCARVRTKCAEKTGVGLWGQS